MEENERLAFVLHDMSELPFDEIAPMAGRSPLAAPTAREQGTTTRPGRSLNFSCLAGAWWRGRDSSVGRRRRSRDGTVERLLGFPGFSRSGVAVFGGEAGSGSPRR